jgi:hypothetical protein
LKALARQRSVVTETLQTPDRRRCERCGRVERWDADAVTWTVAAGEAGPRVGSRHCVHEWDIDGTFRPFP